jgi:single-strand DNA-binding protein
MATNINRIIMTGNLTADPELRATASGTSVCKLRVACNTRRKDPASGEWVDKPNYFNVTVWGTQGENAARYLAKGRAIALDGRLEWREWEAQDASKRQGTEIIADSVQFLGSPNNGTQPSDSVGAEPDFVPVPVPVGVGDGDPDIPF